MHETRTALTVTSAKKFMSSEKPWSGPCNHPNKGIVYLSPWDTIPYTQFPDGIKSFAVFPQISLFIPVLNVLVLLFKSNLLMLTFFFFFITKACTIYSFKCCATYKSNSCSYLHHHIYKQSFPHQTLWSPLKLMRPKKTKTKLCSLSCLRKGKA